MPITNKYYIPSRKYEPEEMRNVRIVGSPTIDGFNLSDFSLDNYAIADSNFITNDVQSFEVVVHFNSGPWTSGNNLYARIINGKLTGSSDSTTGCTIGLENNSTYGNFCYMFFYNGSSFILCHAIRNGAPDTEYWAKWTYDGTDFTGSYSTDGETFTVTQTIQPSFQPRFSAPQYYIGRRENRNSYDYETVFKGTIYLEDTYIKVNSQDYWSGVKSYTPSPQVSDELIVRGGNLSNAVFTGVYGAYIKTINTPPLSTADNWEFRTKYMYQSGGGAYPTIFGYAGGTDYKHPTLLVQSGALRFYISSNGTSWDLNSSGSSLTLVNGTMYYLKAGFNGTEYYIDYNTTGWNDTFTRVFTKSSTTKVHCSVPTMIMNLSLNNNYWNAGSMYLMETELIVDGTTLWKGAHLSNLKSKIYIPSRKASASKYVLQNLTQNGGTLLPDLIYKGRYGASLITNEVLPLSTANSWEFQTKYMYNGGGAYPAIFGYAGGVDYKGPSLSIVRNYLKMNLSSNGSDWDINSALSSLAPVIGTVYYLKAGFTGTEYYIDYNTTGWNDAFTRVFTLNSTTKVYCSVPIMFMNISINNNYWSGGFMDLKETKFTVDNTVYEYYTSAQAPITKPYIPTRKS